MSKAICQIALQQYKIMTFYKRNLPHWQPQGAEYFITFRLAGSLPYQVVNELSRQREKILDKYNESNSGLKPEIRDHVQRKIFKKYEHLLDGIKRGPIWLKEEKVAQIVQEALHYRDKTEYNLYAYSIMPNHVHLVFKHLAKSPKSLESKAIYLVTNILQELKRFTARECNKLLNRKGQFWHHESFDRAIRNNNELQRTIDYTLNNPVKSNFVDYWEDWSHNYCKPDFINTFRK